MRHTSMSVRPDTKRKFDEALAEFRVETKKLKADNSDFIEQLLRLIRKGR